jgi:hypothetical protein
MPAILPQSCMDATHINMDRVLLYMALEDTNSVVFNCIGVVKMQFSSIVSFRGIVGKNCIANVDSVVQG